MPKDSNGTLMATQQTEVGDKDIYNRNKLILLEKIVVKGLIGYGSFHNSREFVRVNFRMSEN